MSIFAARPPRAPRKPLRRLLDVAWRSPLLAIPFALFFGTLSGGGRAGYAQAYRASLVFTYVVSLTFWFSETFVTPRLHRQEGLPRPGRVALYAGVYMATAIAGSAVAYVLLDAFVYHGALGDARSLVTAGMFALLFAVLGVSAGFAVHFYRRALDRARAEEELNLARRIQRSFLITEFPELPAMDLHALNVSSRQVSGDFYDVVPAGDGAHLVAIADVSGKGVPAALLTSMLQASLRTQAGSVRSVAEILRNINRLAYRSTNVRQFATFFLARLEREPLRLTFSNAGHNWPVIVRSDGRREFLVEGGVVVGILENAAFEERSVELSAGDRLVFYTDGVTEAENAAGEMFGEERLYRLIEELPRSLAAKDVNQSILDGVRGFLAGAEPNDDITLLTLRVADAAGV